MCQNSSNSMQRASWYRNDILKLADGGLDRLLVAPEDELKLIVR